MEQSRQHRQELEQLALRRLPVAMAVLLVFLAGSLPLELFYFEGRLGAYLLVYGAEVLASAVAYGVARLARGHVRRVATVWAAVMGLCINAYYPLVGGDATLALAALICLIAAVPTIMPFTIGHQIAFGSTCGLGLAAIMALGVQASLPTAYVAVAFSAVMTATAIGAYSQDQFRWQAFQRGARLRQAHEQLRAALARAESAASMRGRLVANVSHELRTPLNVIVGYADMLLDPAADPGLVAQAVPRIRDYAASLEVLVSDLLDLSRLSSGKVDLALEDVAVPDLLEQIGAHTRLLVRGKPVVVTVDCRLPRCHTDRLKLSQVLTNLTANAAKFTDAGTIGITARAEREAAVFEVSDTGCGIPEELQESVFTAFEQVAPASDRSGGIGLGLAIVRQITELLGGAVSVRSTHGLGSTFTVAIPVGPATPARVRRDPAAAADAPREAAG